MMDKDTKVTERLTVSDVIDQFEGEKFNPRNPDRDFFECDYCSKGVKYQSKPKASMYISDTVLNPEHPAWRNRPDHPDILVPLATYGPECSTRLLYFPCEGFNEIRTTFQIDRDRVMRDVKVTDISRRDDGIPWNPKRLSEKITGISFEQQLAQSEILGGQSHLWGPENMVTFFLAISDGIDIRELVNWDGSINGKLLGQARNQFDDFIGAMARGESFKDRVK